MISLLALAPGLLELAQSVEVPGFDREGIHAEVAELFDEARESAAKEPAEPEAWWKLGALFDAHELLSQAEVCYRRAHDLAPEEFRSLYLLALVSDRLGRPAEVTLPMFTACAELEPGYAPVWLNIGLALARQGRDDDALAAYEAALETDPRLTTARRCLGQLLLARGEVESAKGHLEAVAAIAPEDRATSISLARVYAMLGQREFAREMAERSRTQKASLTYVDPVRAEVLDLAASTLARFRRAESYRAFGEVDEAVSELEELLLIRPDHPGAHVLLGDLYLGRGDTEKAQKHLRRAAVLDPMNPDVRFVLGQLLLAREGDGPWVRTAISHLRMAVELAPQDQEARELLGVGLTRRGRHAAAIAQFERAAEGDRELDERSFLLWGRALFQVGRLEGALACFRESILFHPDSGHLRYSLGIALEQSGRVGEAIAAYERALELGTDLPAQQRIDALRAGGAPEGSAGARSPK